ncbi:MAG: hypothetical protein DRR16_18360 [Candidatus Parabeggiatoa sp. nov. 3]|nr:MAG: hypothetical protein DRR00_23510 [Gammaproteobacteria bacterium]RKZ61621.1 MAG: hypothetical protein DRQ99_20135 [Gammaproteobacteria bacterium]RKZ83014.1 MAG: hypothetical protein DRR16_18360 [Gammaproteobacteria bacterium]HEW98904.1 hypothetical protein [Beggiatoa sp.]
MNRLTPTTETVESVTTTSDYHYDLAGSLDEIKPDGVIVKAYSYDDNSNCFTAETAIGSVILCFPRG